MKAIRLRVSGREDPPAQTKTKAQTGTWINTSADRPRVECLRCGVVLTPGERFLKTCVAGRTPTTHLVTTEAGVAEVTP